MPRSRPGADAGTYLYLLKIFIFYLFSRVRERYGLNGTAPVFSGLVKSIVPTPLAITFTFLTGVKLVITEGLPEWDHSDDVSIRKKNLLSYAFIIAPAVAPIVYLWGVL